MSLLFSVVDTNFLRIKGPNSSRQLNLIERKPSISNSEKRNFWSVNPWRHTSCFGEIRTLWKALLITIDQNITAVVTPARKTLIAMLDQLKSELEIVQRPEIVWPVSELTKWINPLVIVKKPNGKLGICVDPKHLNQSIKGQHCKFPTAEEFFSKKDNANFCEKLYLFSACFSTKVDGDSSKLLYIFETIHHTSIYAFTLLDNKWKWSFFQQHIEKIIESSEGERNTQNDIIMWVWILNKLDIHTKQVLNRIRTSGLKLKKDKRVFCSIGTNVFETHNIRKGDFYRFRESQSNQRHDFPQI